MNWIPILAQLKSIVQALAGDYEGASQTQSDFIRTCPLISQITSSIQACRGDCESARQTQIKFLLAMSLFIDNIPGIGYIKGIIHYALGRKDRGDHAIKASSRTVGLLGIASVGFYLNDLFGSTIGGIFGGIIMDAVTTGAETIIYGKYMPNGTLYIMFNIESDWKHRAGHVFDLVAIACFDGLTGFSAGIGNKEAVASFS